MGAILTIVHTAFWKTFVDDRGGGVVGAELESTTLRRLADTTSTTSSDAPSVCFLKDCRRARTGIDALYMTALTVTAILIVQHLTITWPSPGTIPPTCIIPLALARAIGVLIAVVYRRRLSPSPSPNEDAKQQPPSQPRPAQIAPLLLDTREETIACMQSSTIRRVDSEVIRAGVVVVREERAQRAKHADILNHRIVKKLSKQGIIPSVGVAVEEIGDGDGPDAVQRALPPAYTPTPGPAKIKKKRRRSSKIINFLLGKKEKIAPTMEQLASVVEASPGAVDDMVPPPSYIEPVERRDSFGVGVFAVGSTIRQLAGGVRLDYLRNH